jgi:peptidoglycan/LPS O-acetylase OafA/YrhL
MNKRIQWLSAVRALGLLLVLVYHFFRDSLPGGFVGVDVFFTLSGYLTTALLVEELRKSDAFRLPDFYKRRFLRIFPPLAVALAVTLPFALLVSPDFTAGVGRQAAGALGFVTNYFEILNGGSYEAQLLPHLYIHTWSLALEMHYYLLWGLVCFGLALLVRRLARNKERARLRALKGCVVAVSLGLAALCCWRLRALFAANPEDPSAAYFDSMSHGLPFFIGSAAGALFGVHLPEKITARLRGAAALVGSLLAISLSAGALVYLGRTLAFAGEETYRYGFAAASLLAALFICGARALHEASKAKEPRALAALADLSYCVYLFHWPLYIVFSDLIAQNWLASLLTLALSFVFSAMVHYGVEPLLRGRKKKRRAMRIFYPAIAMLAATALAGSALALLRAPQVTEIEQAILNGSIHQDADELARLERKVLAVNPEPAAAARAHIPAYGDADEGASGDDFVWVPPAQSVDIPGGVTILGDSICVDARTALLASISNCDVDAKSSRNLAQGHALMLEMLEEGSLREVLVIALGANGFDEFADYIQLIIDDLPPGRRLVFVTPYDGRTPKGWAYRTAVTERELSASYDFVTVADWHAIIREQEKLLAADKVHLRTQASRQIYVGCIAEAVQLASLGQGKPAQ